MQSIVYISNKISWKRRVVAKDKYNEVHLGRLLLCYFSRDIKVIVMHRVYCDDSFCHR